MTAEPLLVLGYDAYAHYARNLLARVTHSRLQASSFRSDLSPSPLALADGSLPWPKDPVGIIGAGMSGLYAALILEDLGIPYKVIEARERVGGRLFTHTFKNDTGAPYNYFGVGAMRFPHTDAMRRVFHLFNYRPLNSDGISLASRLRPFFFNGGGNDNTLRSYYGITVRQDCLTDDESTVDPFNSKDVILDTPPALIDAYIKIGPIKIVDDVLRPFVIAILEDVRSGGSSRAGWEKLMKYDKYSTRTFMGIAYEPSKELLEQGMPSGPLSTDVINWCETFQNATGVYDTAFSEAVLDAIAFGWNSDPDAPPTSWYCIDGGSINIADAMHAYLSKKNPDAFMFNSLVTAISSIDQTHAEVTVSGGQKYKFSSVISTIPLPVLRTIDLSAAGLSSMQSAALRDLNYGPSTKIGMQFRSAWWTTGDDKDGNPLNIVGGQTYTDRPIRTVVYPSCGTSVQAGTTTTLIASYCWTDDALRLGALIEREPDLLKDLVLKELALLHNVTYDFLKDRLIDWFPYSWTNDPYSMGAFPYFGPGKFASVYCSLNAPAGKGNIIFSGEALSVRHCWVEGALDSAWKAVSILLFDRYTAKGEAIRRRFIENWGVNLEWVAPPPSLDQEKWCRDKVFDPSDSLLYRLMTLSASR